MSWIVPGFVAAFDRFKQTITLVRNVFIEPSASLEGQYQQALADLREAAASLALPLRYEPESFSQLQWSGGPMHSTLDRAAFMAGVERVKEYVRQGDAFQVVLSQRLETDFSDDPFGIYRVLRIINPSPYLFFVRTQGVVIAGSSPELMTRVRDGQVYSRPIAGTRPRGATPDDDLTLERELLADEKELAEHVMLIDLARNDLGRVCEFGSVCVDDLMVIEKYSHVMHIVSGVSGKLRAGMSPIDVIRAVFPHGTVSGAPKVRAMEIIDELEPVARGPYAGAVGYIDFSGNVDTAICLRTVVVADGKAWVQAGAGLVADSDPATEYEETMNKAAAALAAVEAAQRG
jgi:anthranilate synthase component 1